MTPGSAEAIKGPLNKKEIGRKGKLRAEESWLKKTLHILAAVPVVTLVDSATGFTIIPDRGEQNLRS